MAPHSSTLAWNNPRDRGAWWAAVYGVAQSRTRLKRLSSSSREEEGALSGTDQWQNRAVNWLLVDSCSLGWEEGPTGMPSQRLRRTVIVCVCLSGACRLEPGSERPFVPWGPSGTTTIQVLPKRRHISVGGSLRARSPDPAQLSSLWESGAQNPTGPQAPQATGRQGQVQAN